MSYITSLYVCHEIIVDSNNNFISEHETNLTHAELISKTFCEQFDRAAEDYLLNIMNNELGNRIALLKAMPSKARNETIISIRITAKPGVRFTSKLRNAVYDFMSSQFSDGWGEGFFGPANIITANDGTRFYID